MGVDKLVAGGGNQVVELPIRQLKMNEVNLSVTSTKANKKANQGRARPRVKREDLHKSYYTGCFFFIVVFDRVKLCFIIKLTKSKISSKFTKNQFIEKYVFYVLA